MDAKLKAHVETLLEKAANADEAPKAINYAQAALNAANAIRVLAETEKTFASPTPQEDR